MYTYELIDLETWRSVFHVFLTQACLILIYKDVRQELYLDVRPNHQNTESGARRQRGLRKTVPQTVHNMVAHFGKRAHTASDLTLGKCLGVLSLLFAGD